MLAREAPDVERLERSGARDVLAGEVELERRRASAVEHGSFALFVGWVPVPAASPQLAERLAPLGASLLELPASARPGAADAAGARAGGASRSGRCSTPTAPCPTQDVDPTPFAALTYCLMFGMMFGDVGDGLLIVLAALALRRSRRPRLARAARGMADDRRARARRRSLFGLLYGEFFGPTQGAADAVARAAGLAHPPARRWRSPPAAACSPPAT